MNSTSEQDKWLASVLNRTPGGDVVAVESPSKPLVAAPGAPPPPPPPGPVKPGEDPPPEPKKPVKKPRATIVWAPPAPVDTAQGTFNLTVVQLNATTNPPGLPIVYLPALGAPLHVGTHDLVASLDPAATHEADPVQVRLVVRKPRATITWPTPAPLPWTQGGITPGSPQLNATVAPPGATITYTPKTPYPLPIGTHEITASLADTEPFTANPVTVMLTVTKGKATITWPQPAPMTWATGGVTPGKDQLNATTEPSGLNITYPDLPQSPLEPGTYTVTATLNDPNHEGAPVPRDLVVNKAPHGLTWAGKLTASITKNGLTMGEKFKGAVKNSNGLTLVFTPPIGTVFTTVGPQPISVTITETTHYDDTPLTGTLVIGPGKATIKLNAPTTLRTGPEGTIAFDTAILNATTEPADLALEYYPEAATDLYPGKNTITVSLAASVTNFTADPKTTTITVVDGSSPQPNAPTTTTTTVAPPQVLATIPPGEWPVGGPNITPHIHHYSGSDYHLKMVHRGRVRRMNIVQGGELHTQHTDALEAAASVPAVLAIVEAIVKGCPPKNPK